MASNPASICSRVTGLNIRTRINQFKGFWPAIFDRKFEKPKLCRILVSVAFTLESIMQLNGHQSIANSCFAFCNLENDPLEKLFRNCCSRSTFNRAGKMFCRFFHHVSSGRSSKFNFFVNVTSVRDRWIPTTRTFVETESHHFDRMSSA